MTFYRRNLPHWFPEGASIFLTWRLHGSLPLGSGAMRGGRSDSTARNGCATKPKAGFQNGCATRTRTGFQDCCATKDSPGRRFKLLDAALDTSSTGPFWLKDPRVADSVVEIIRKGDSVLGYFTLHAFVVMPNHVHLLITPKLPVHRIMNGLKGASSRQANAILSRKGRHFWQEESFDHWVRTSREFDRIRIYIENNPVSAGLAAKPQDWSWSSASVGIGKSGCVMSS